MSWIAAKGAGRAAILGGLGLAEAGEARMSAPMESPEKFFAFEHGGWLFVVASDDHRFASRERVSAASRGGLAVGSYLEEHVMVSGAFGASDGQLTWSVQHDPNEELEHLDVWGEPPAALAEIHGRLLEKVETDDSVDFIFDAPVEVAASVCGFNPNDFDDEVDIVELTVVQRDLMKLRDHPPSGRLRDPSSETAASRKPGFFARLFGAR